MSNGDSAAGSSERSLKKGDRVWVLGTVRDIHGDRADVAFAEWWPPWASVLAPIERCRIAVGADEPPPAAHRWPV